MGVVGFGMEMEIEWLQSHVPQNVLFTRYPEFETIETIEAL